MGLIPKQLKTFVNAISKLLVDDSSVFLVVQDITLSAKNLKVDLKKIKRLFSGK